MIDLANVIFDYAQKNVYLTILNEIKSGKEATVYKVLWNDELFALKAYKDNSHTSFNRYADYREGKYVKRPSDRKAIQKKNNYGRKLIEYSRTLLEYKVLYKLFLDGANVPKVYEYTKNSILMEYLGDYNIAAPKIKDINLSKKELKNAYEIILRNIKLFYENGIVHGDLSEFNILWWNKKPYIIDFPQAIDIRSNPNAELMLNRDTQNVKNFFDK